MEKISKVWIITLAVSMALALSMGLSACGGSGSDSSASSDTKEAIESALDLSNMDAEWTYDGDADAWTMSPVTAVTAPEIEDEQGVSVCVPGAYVLGIDTDGDGAEDVTAADAEDALKGCLIVNTQGSITSSNGQKYTAAAAPVIVNTGAAGYSEQENQTAAVTYAAEGYINVACGNRGKQSTVTDEEGNESFTGDAPCCLVDQKNAVRFVKYNILLGNLPGSVDRFVSTGGSGGGAHAAMLAATSDNADFYPYMAEAGAVGCYPEGDSYTTTVTIDGEETELSDGMWGCMAYSAITSLAEADMAMAMEYYLDPDYDFNTDFQKQMAAFLSEEYREYINEKDLSAEESRVGFDLDGDGKLESSVALTIDYDEEKYSDTNGYGGTYLQLYLAEFRQSLADYLNRLDYAEDWTWFDASGDRMADDAVAAMSSEDKVQAFIEGRYAKGSSSGSDRMDGAGGPQNGTPPDGAGPGDDSAGGPPDMDSDDNGAGGPPDMDSDDNSTAGETSGQEEVGTPDAGTTQASGSSTDSSNYESYADMLAAYQADIAEVEAGDDYGNNIVSLYDPVHYIGAEGTSDPVWTRILCGACEGDISMMNSLNLQIAWLNAGTDAEIEWQWDGGHVPAEILGDSLPLYVDMMYGKYVDGAVEVEKAKAGKVTENGDAEEAAGTDLSDWVSYDSKNGVSFSLASIAAYRTSGAAKAIPGFDVIDYGQEDYVFGSSTADARHWDKHVLQVLEEQQETLEKLFNAGS